MRLLKPLIIAFLMAFPWLIEAQIPAPQINLTGNLGCQGFPCLNSGTLTMTDANRTMTATETSATGGFLVTGTWTANRTLTMPAGRFQFVSVGNTTVGGFSLILCSASGGSCLTIPNGQAVTGVWFNGTGVTGTLASTFPASSPPPIGNIMPNTGAFTTVTAGSYAGNGASQTALYLTQGSAAAAAPANTIRFGAPTSVTSSYDAFLPTLAPTDSGGDIWVVPNGGGTGIWQPVSKTLATPQALWGFGDSYMAGDGATSPNATGVFALLSRDTPAALANNRGISGLSTAQISVETLDFFAPLPSAPSVTLLDGGANDANNDSCGGVSPSACIIDYKNELLALEAWLTIPYQYRQLASASSQSGSWSASTIIYVNPLLASIGTPLNTSSSGASLTFSVPSSASPVIGVTYQVTTTTTGTFTVTVDGVAKTDNCSSTTTFTSTPCTALPLSTSAFFRQEFAVTSGISHTVVITSTSANATNIVSVDWVPPSNTANENVVFPFGTNAIWPNATIYDTASKAVATQLLADGLPVYFVDVQNGTPGVNDTTDISTSATMTCPASLNTDHPNDCGYNNLLLTINNTELAAGYVFSELNQGGKAVALSGNTNVPLNVTTVQGTMKGAFSTFCSFGSIGCGVLYFNNPGTGFFWGAGMQQDGSSGLPWSGAFNNLTFGVNGWACDALYDGSGNSGPGDFTSQRCTNYSTGETYQLGGATMPYLVLNGSQQLIGVQGTSGTKLLAYGGAVGSAGVFLSADADGNATSSTYSATSFAQTSTNNLFTGSNNFANNTQFFTSTTASQPSVAITNTGITGETGTTAVSYSLTAATGAIKATIFQTLANCVSSAAPAVCGAATAGAVAIPAGIQTLTVDTTAVTANSRIFLIQDESLGTSLGVTCNTASLGDAMVMGTRTPGTSFQFSSSATPSVNPLCVSYLIVN